MRQVTVDVEITRPSFDINGLRTGETHIEKKQLTLPISKDSAELVALLMELVVPDTLLTSINVQWPPDDSSSSKTVASAVASAMRNKKLQTTIM